MQKQGGLLERQHEMIRSAIAGLLSILLLGLLLFNAYLLISLIDGANVVRAAEEAAGQTLSCFELYGTEAIENYYYPDHVRQGEVIYLTGILFPLWLGVSVGLPFLLAIVLGRARRWYWLPLALMAPLLLLIGLHFRVLSKLVCALE